MFCVHCGSDLPDDVHVCLTCGTPQQSNLQPEQPPWETCEITWRTVRAPVDGVAGWKFWAGARGPRGQYNAGESPLVPGNHPSTVPSDRHVLAELVAQLVHEGWEPLPTQGREWYSRRFRRRAT